MSEQNGNKMGYIHVAVMTELWVEKGYEHLGIKSQNPRDQTSRLEKMDDSTCIGETCATDATNGGMANTVPPESIYPLGRSKTLSLPKCSAANSPWWDEFLNLTWTDVTERRSKQDVIYRGEETIQANLFC